MGLARRSKSERKSPLVLPSTLPEPAAASDLSYWGGIGLPGPVICGRLNLKGSEMCEYCAVSESWGEPLEKGGAGRKCEWMPDPEETLNESMDPDEMFDPFAACDRVATRASIDSTAEDHLCEQHQRDELRDAEGLGEVIEGYPSEQSSRLVTINAEVACDYVGDLLSDSASRCGESATHVRLMTQRAVFCEDHFPTDGDLE